MKIKIQIGLIEVNYTAVITDAPPAYDGFGAFTALELDSPALLESGVETKGNARYALVRDEHLAWQLGRYASGLHMCEPVSSENDYYGLEELLFTRLQTSPTRH